MLIWFVLAKTVNNRILFSLSPAAGIAAGIDAGNCGFVF